MSSRLLIELSLSLKLRLSNAIIAVVVLPLPPQWTFAMSGDIVGCHS